jgi:hypothetical protein
MTKGIREFANTKFVASLAVLAEKGPTPFRAKVIDSIVKKFDISVASAATHYNYAFKEQKAAAPETVIGLGRDEDKKGGRKPIYLFTVVRAKSLAVVVEGLSRAKADALVASAAGKGKVKLAILEDIRAAEALAAEADAVTA